MASWSCTGPLAGTALENLATEAESQAEQLATEVAAAETRLGDGTWWSPGKVGHRRPFRSTVTDWTVV